MRKPGRVLLLILLGALAAIGEGWLPAGAQSKPAVRLNDAERKLVGQSRNAVVRTGMSPGYFDRHFKLVKVVNQSADRRVVWQYSLNEYNTTVTDVLGYYTKDGKRFDTHSVEAMLRATSDIKTTISRRKANQMMQQCIGSFRNVSIEYRAADGGGARLFLTAEAVPRRARRSKEEREREEREEREREARAKATGSDPIENEGEKGPPIIVGSIDLQTGKCTKGELEVAALMGGPASAFADSGVLSMRLVLSEHR